LIYADGGCWWLPMSMKGDLPMVAEGRRETCREKDDGAPTAQDEQINVFLFIRVCFVYGFHPIWN